MTVGDMDTRPGDSPDWENKLPASAVTVTQSGVARRLDEVLKDLDGGEVTIKWADVTGKPATFPPTIGKTATTAMAGNTTIPPAPAADRLVPTGGTNGQVLKVNADGKPVWGVDVDTKLTAMTAAAAEAGTETTARSITAKVLHDEVARQVAEAIATPPAGGE